MVILIELLLIALFLALNALEYFDTGYVLPRDSMLRLDMDRGYPEMFNYAVLAATVALLVRIFVLTKEPVYAAWALVFSFVLADDSLSIHESGGRSFESRFAGPTLPGLRLNDTGELLTWSIAAAVLLAILIWAFRKSTPEAIGFGGVFAFIFALLVVFGAGLDMIHIALGSRSRIADRLLVIVEDGGEMLAIALAFASALLLYRLTASASGSTAGRHDG